LLNHRYTDTGFSRHAQKGAFASTILSQEWGPHPVQKIPPLPMAFSSSIRMPTKLEIQHFAYAANADSNIMKWYEMDLKYGVSLNAFHRGTLRISKSWRLKKSG